MRHHTVAHQGRHGGLNKRIGRLATTAGRLKSKTGRALSKSLRSVRAKTKDIPHKVDRAFVKKRYQTLGAGMGAAMLTGLCIGYFIKK